MSGLTKMMDLRIVFTLFLSLAMTSVALETAFSQVLLATGLYSGTLERKNEDAGISPVSYFVDSLGRASELSKALNSKALEVKLITASQAYDFFVIVAHPESIVNGKINKKIATYGNEQQITHLDKALQEINVVQGGCATAPVVVHSEQSKSNVLFIYLYYPINHGENNFPDFTSCLMGSLNVAAGLGN